MTDPKPEPNLQRVRDVDRLVHEPARLLLLATLAVTDGADFVFLQRQTGLTNGNISSHMTRLEAAGLVAVEKMFVARTPRTLYRLTATGRDALRGYRKQMEGVLGLLPE